MLHVFLDTSPWFHPKRYGIGAGLPCAWQGWALLCAYIAVVLGAALAAIERPLVGLVLIVAATVVFALVARRHTRGGWKWRTGSE